jgi:Winged helix DNA-binding domain
MGKDTAPDIALLRLAAQRLVGPRFSTPGRAMHWLVAAQAQDHRGVLESVALRTAAGVAAVEAAMDAGEIVKSWPMRGTLHLTPAEDLPWLLKLLAPRVLSSSKGRRAGLGLDAAQLKEACAVAVDALSGGRRLSRPEMFALWDEAGLATKGQRGVHILRYLAMDGVLVYGPADRGAQSLVLLDEWIREPRRLDDKGEALAELALRYFRSHGPASAADLSRWAGLTATETKTATAGARDELATITVDGQEYLLSPDTSERLGRAGEDAERTLLLPGFDEFILGYGDRSAQLDPLHGDRIVPGGNGIFRPTVVHRGRVLGTWSRDRKNAPVTEPFTTFPRPVADALARGRFVAGFS